MKLLHHLFNLLDERMEAPTEGRFRLRLTADRMAGRPLTWRTAEDVEFLAPIHPEATPEVEVRLSMDGGRVTAQVEDGPVCHAKLSLRYE